MLINIIENINTSNPVGLSSAILSIGLIIDSTNFFLKKELYYDDIGLFSYNKLVFDRRKNLKSIFIKYPYLFRYKHFFLIMIVRLFLSLLLLFHLSNHWLIFLVLFLIQLVFNLRNVHSLSGADQMQTIFLFGLLIFSFNFNNSISMLSLFFITIQLLLSYFFTGFHKMRSKKWRNGEALILSLNSEAFGDKRVLSFLHRNKIISIVLSWGIILIQFTFVFAFLFFPQYIIFYLIGLFCFHLSVAYLMNLNHFFWVFISSYPIVYFILFNNWNF